MKTSLIILASLSVSTSAFAPARTFSRGVSTKVFNEPEEEGGLDLNLEEMFDMFNAADKGADFEKTLEKVKGDKKDK